MDRYHKAASTWSKNAKVAAHYGVNGILEFALNLTTAEFEFEKAQRSES